MYSRILLLLLLWGISWLLPFYLLRKKNKSYLEVPFLFTFAFLLGAVPYLWIFGNELIQYRSSIPLFLLIQGIISGFVYIYYKLIRSRLEMPAELRNIPISEYWMMLDTRYIIPKTAEIISQQLFITILVQICLENNLNRLSAIGVFALVFGIAHFPLFISKSRGWAFFYSSFAVLSAVIFPVTVYTFSNGPMINVAVHWAFYLVSGLVLWLKL